MRTSSLRQEEPAFYERSAASAIKQLSPELTNLSAESFLQPGFQKGCQAPLFHNQQIIKEI
jgi:hypothetical protein